MSEHAQLHTEHIRLGFNAVLMNQTEGKQTLKLQMLKGS